MMFDIKRAINIGMALYGVSHAQLAEQSGIGVSALSNLKNKGNPTLSTITKLSSSFGVPLSVFIGWGEHGQ